METLQATTEKSMEAAEPNHENHDIINPEIPETPDEKLDLLRACLAAIALDARVEGVTPKHVGSEGMLMINRLKAGQDKSGL